ncbi:CCT domain-containing protein [Cephalotus follicularis]|uniref:CCT domain-containing protein n=1 Tax=Cephalotus follicularis TaxID=3775 RepID=A0A1Q3CVP0_CEPFO|nr:CCT domain-containing protein [Cephalotus follicularis]
MSSCFSGGGRTYALDLELVKSTSISSRTSHTSSPSSTLSESSNSPLAISTRKPRTPRKRPNQTYNEAAALLSTAYPNIFPTKNFSKNPSKFTKQQLHHYSSSFDDSSDLLLPFRVMDTSGFLLHQPIQEKPSFHFNTRVQNLFEKPCESSGEIDSRGKSMELASGEIEEDFDAESILDEEIEEGIDSIMGNLSANKNYTVDEYSNCGGQIQMDSYSWYDNPMGIGFGGKLDFGFGVRSGVRAFRTVDDGNWWSFPTVDVLQISPKSNINNSDNNNNNNKSNKNKVSNWGDKKKKKKVEKPAVLVETKKLEKEIPKENPIPMSKSGLLLKLNYDEVLTVWSGRGSPFSDEILGSDVTGSDLTARLAQIDLFSESGIREASVLRYKEKRRTRLFSKKIRYQVRKVNADQRPRMKGRFVRRLNSSTLLAKDEKKRKEKENMLF